MGFACCAPAVVVGAFVLDGSGGDFEMLSHEVVFASCDQLGVLCMLFVILYMVWWYFLCTARYLRLLSDCVLGM